MRHKTLSFTLLTALLFSPFAKAEDDSPIFQTHGHFCLLSSSFAAPSVGITGTYSSSNTFDLTLEYLPKKSTSYFVHQQISFDTETSAVRYLYTGLGARFYWGPAERMQSSESGLSISSEPKWRPFASWEAGVSQMLLNSISPVFGTTATFLEFYVGLGTIYQVSKNFGIETQAEFGNGFGIGNQPASSTTTKFYLGGTLSY
jgi:hypothetical protein